MPIKALLKTNKNGFYITFTPGMRVSMVQGEYGYEPRRPYMTAAQKRAFAAGSAGISADALIEALEPLAEELKDLCPPCTIYTIVETVMLIRSAVRGRVWTGLTEAQYGRINVMMGLGAEPISADDAQFWRETYGFNIDDVIKDITKQ